MIRTTLAALLIAAPLAASAATLTESTTSAAGFGAGASFGGSAHALEYTINLATDDVNYNFGSLMFGTYSFTLLNGQGNALTFAGASKVDASPSVPATLASDNETFVFTIAQQDNAKATGVFTAAADASSSAVPLPAALPLMLAGLAGLGFAGRRRR